MAAQSTAATGMRNFFLHAVLIAGLALSIPLFALAAAYGAGTYGNGLYGSGDDTAPSVSITAPSNSSTVSGSSISVTATATDNISIVGVQFKYDNNNIGAEDTTSAYGVSWDSTAVSDGSHTLSAVARDSSGNLATSTVTVTVDNTAPVRSAGSPTGTLALNTTSTTLSLTTNEAATCKYSTSSGTAYGSMTAFDTTGATSHSTTVSGLSNAGSYIYYVKCQDGQGNTNATDYSISFTVAADTTSPSVAITAPTNSAIVSGSSVTISADASDDVSVSGVQFKLDGSTNIGAEDTSAAYSVAWDSTAAVDGSHTLTAVARDGSSNITTSAVITVTIDNTSPVRSAGAPSGALVVGTTATTLSVTTNEAATCKYSTSSGTAYGSMTAFSTTSGTSHSSAISGLTPASYTYYVKCQDGQGNTNATDYSISFSVAADTTAPAISSISSGTPGQAGTTITWTTDENANSQVVYGLTSSYGSQTTLDTNMGTAHGVSITGLAASTAYHFAVVSADSSGNTATSSDQTFTTASNDDAAIEERDRRNGGGGGVVILPTPVVVGLAANGLTAQQVQSILDLLASFGADQAAIDRVTLALNGQASSGIAAGAPLSFARDLQLGMKGEDVRRLQQYLNGHGDMVSASGGGSLGQETDYFGALTYRALVEFQNSHAEAVLYPLGLTAGTGFFGPATRAYVNTFRE